MNDTSTHDRRIWWRLQPVSEALGLSPDTTLAAVSRGELPFRLQSFGAKGLIHVLAADVRAYVESLAPAKTFSGMSQAEFDEGAPAPSGYWRLNGLAVMLDVDPVLLRAQCEAGEVPLEVICFGPNDRPYVRAVDALGYLATRLQAVAS